MFPPVKGFLVNYKAACVLLGFALGIECNHHPLRVKKAEVIRIPVYHRPTQEGLGYVMLVPEHHSQIGLVLVSIGQHLVRIFWIGLRI